MAVEEDRGGGAQELQQGETGAELVDEEVVWVEAGELAGIVDGEEEVGLAEDGAEDHEAAEVGGADQGVAADVDFESAWRGGKMLVSCSLHRRREFMKKKKEKKACLVCLTISGFLKAVALVTMAREDDDFVTSVLEADSRINHKSLSTSNAKIRVKEDNGLWVALSVCHLANEMAHTI